MGSRLDEIATAIKNGANPEDFRKELDRLLGTEMQERDVDMDEAWENSYRKGRDQN